MITESSITSLRSSCSCAVKILSVGNDPRLLDSNTAVLSGAGYQVKPVTLQQTLKSIDAERFDAVVLCHSLKPGEAQAVLSLVRSSFRFDIPIIQIYARTPDPAFRFSSPSYNPANLLSVVDWALRPELRASA